MRSQSFSRRSRKISAAGSETECGPTPACGAQRQHHIPPSAPITPIAKHRGLNAQFRRNLRQRPTAARQQGHHLPLELIRKLTTSLAQSTPSRSLRSLAKVSTNRGRLTGCPAGIDDVFSTCNLPQHADQLRCSDFQRVPLFGPSSPSNPHLPSNVRTPPQIEQRANPIGRAISKKSGNAGLYNLSIRADRRSNDGQPAGHILNNLVATFAALPQPV
jgi:hypothetical protein